MGALRGHGGSDGLGRRGGRLVAAAAATLACCAVLAPAALAATVTVDTSGDPGSPDCTAGHAGGTCSLRGAIGAAAPGDTVSIAPGINPVLGGTEISIGQDVTIAGQGARATTVSGNNASRIFHVTAGTVAISGLTLTGGHATLGGALQNDSGATVTLTDVAVTGNVVDGASAYGAGIVNSGTLTLLRVTVANNNGSSTDPAGGAAGGGIFSGGTLTATNSTVTNNSSSGSGSGSVTGGGIYNNGTATLVNVTVASNTVTATGSGAGSGGNITAVGVGGVVVTLKNTIVAYGSAASGSNCFVQNTAVFTSQGGNLETTAPSQCGLGTGDLVGADPLLAPLANNGGQTDTRALGAGSPAIDAVPAANCPPPASDQRGVARPQGPRCDIGAFESQGSLLAPPPPPAPPAQGAAPPPKTTPTAAQLLLGCSHRRLTLTDVFIRGHRVVLAGLADAGLVGKRVDILFAGTTRVARAVVASDGSFGATAALPPARLRATNKARYVARSGAARSLDLKLTRRVVLHPLTSANGKVTIVGQVLRPLAKPIASIAIQQQVSCTRTVTVARFRPPASGRIRFTVDAPAGQTSAVYRLATRVRTSARSLKTFPTFSLPQPVVIH